MNCINVNVQFYKVPFQVCWVKREHKLHVHHIYFIQKFYNDNLFLISMLIYIRYAKNGKK